MNNDYVQLNRKFFESRNTHNTQDENSESLFGYSREELSWDDLINEYRVILLAEAGSGKTSEIFNKARELKALGENAFFIRLESILGDFEGAFEVGTYEEFCDWQKSDSEAWLFLDSVDEAKLRKPSALGDALRLLCNRINNELQRLHITITSRISAWRREYDLNLCMDRLPYNEAKSIQNNSKVFSDDSSIDIRSDSDQSTKKLSYSIGSTTQSNIPSSDICAMFKIVTFAYLNKEQIHIFANSKNVCDVDGFIHSLDKIGLSPFTNDLLGLESAITYWKKHKTIKGRTEIIEANIDRRLSEWNQDRASLPMGLSKERVRNGVEMLAAALIFTNKSVISLPDGNAQKNGLSMNDVLPDWSSQELSELIDRAIFDQEIYGTVRFHQRIICEFLAAHWIAKLLQKLTSRKKIEALFLKKQYGIDVIVPNMKSILCWLVLLDDQLRDKLCVISPELVFNAEDPNRLPLEIRAKIIKDICALIQREEANIFLLEIQAQKRFATDDLEIVISNLIKEYTNNNDAVMKFLIQMVWYGELKAALPEAKELALNPNTSKDIRPFAFPAISAISSQSDLKIVYQHIANENEEVNAEDFASLVFDLKANEDNLQWLFTCLEKIGEYDKSYNGIFPDAVTEFIKKIPLEFAEQLLAKIRTLLEKRPFCEYCNISKKFEWLLEPLHYLLIRLIEKKSLLVLKNNALSLLCILSNTKHCRNSHYYISKNKLNKAILLWEELNRTLFWYEILLYFSNEPQSVPVKSRMNLARAKTYTNSFSRLNIDDYPYMVEQISVLKDREELEIALHMALYLLWSNENAQEECFSSFEHMPKYLLLLEKAIKLYPDLKIIFREEMDIYKVGLESSQKTPDKWAIASQEKIEKNRIQDEKFYISILENIDKLRDSKLKAGEVSQHQAYLCGMMSNNSAKNHFGLDNWQSLIPQFSEAVAMAFKDGAMLFWRGFKASSLVKNCENSTPYSIILGLTGLAIEAKENPDWYTNLNEQEIENAVMYAIHELATFPSWFLDFFNASPEKISSILIDEIRKELENSSSNYRTIYNIFCLKEGTWEYFAEQLYKVVFDIKSIELTPLKYILKIIQTSSIPDTKIVELATNKCNLTIPLKNKSLWYAMWISCEPKSGFDAFQSEIENNKEQRYKVELVINLIKYLIADDYRNMSIIMRANFKKALYLKKLFDLIFSYVNTNDNANEQNEGDQWVTTQNEANQAKTTLINLIYEIPGKEAYLALMEIANDYKDTHEYAEHYSRAQEKAASDSNAKPWSPEEVFSFFRNCTSTPKDHFELNNLVIALLEDLKDNLENGDYSIAELLKLAKKETLIRNYVASQFRDKAQTRYSITQEGELADAKRPDIRVYGIDVESPIAIELKIADNWSGSKLQERLINQLHGDYLRDMHSVYGIFLLFYRGTKQIWKLDSSVKVNFEDLIKVLQNYWTQEQQNYQHIKDIKVIGIDLTKRKKTK